MSALPYDAIHWKTTLAGDVELLPSPRPLVWPDPADVRAGVTYGPASAPRVGTLALTGGTDPAAIDYGTLRAYLRTRILAEDSIRGQLSSPDAVLGDWPGVALAAPFLTLQLEPAAEAACPGTWRIRAVFTAFARDTATAEDVASRAAALFVGTRFEAGAWRVRAAVSDGMHHPAPGDADADGASLRACAAAVILRAMRRG